MIERCILFFVNVQSCIKLKNKLVLTRKDRQLELILDYGLAQLRPLWVSLAFISSLIVL